MTQQNLAIGAPNLVDATGTVVTCANADPNYPAEDLQNDEIGQPLRTLDRTSATSKVVVTLAASVTLAKVVVAQIKHNFTSAGTYDIVFKDSGGTPVLSVTGRAVTADGFWSSKVDGQSRNIALYQHDGSLTFKSVEITPTDAANPDGYFEIPRLFIGTVIEPAIGIPYGVQFGWSDGSARTTTPGGNMVHRRVTKYRKVTFELKLLTEAEAWDDFFETIDALHGKTNDVLVLVNRTSATRLHKRVIWGVQEDVGMFGTPPAFQRYSKSATYRERT